MHLTLSDSLPCSKNFTIQRWSCYRLSIGKEKKKGPAKEVQRLQEIKEKCTCSILTKWRRGNQSNQHFAVFAHRERTSVFMWVSHRRHPSVWFPEIKIFLNLLVFLSSRKKKYLHSPSWHSLPSPYTKYAPQRPYCTHNALAQGRSMFQLPFACVPLFIRTLRLLV